MCLNCTSLHLRILCSIHHRPCHISRSRTSASRWCEPYYGMVSSRSVHHRRSLATDRASCEYQSLTGAGYSSRWYHRLWHVWLLPVSLPSSSDSAPEEYEFQGAQVSEGSQRINVRIDLRPPIPYCVPLMVPSYVDEETREFLRNRR
jgi:hypothetical protein